MARLRLAVRGLDLGPQLTPDDSTVGPGADKLDVEPVVALLRVSGVVRFPTSFTSHALRAYDESASLFQASASRAQPSVSQTEARCLIKAGRSGLLAF